MLTMSSLVDAPCYGWDAPCSGIYRAVTGPGRVFTVAEGLIVEIPEAYVTVRCDVCGSDPITPDYMDFLAQLEAQALARKRQDQSFMGRALAGEFPDIESITKAALDATDAWHENPGDLQLHEFLGLTWPEFCRYIQSSSDGVLLSIVRDRKRQHALRLG